MLNKSQKESAMIRECLFEGDKVSNEVIRAIKAETRKMDTLHGMTGKKVMMRTWMALESIEERRIIILLVAVKIIKGKLGMPRKIVEYYTRSVGIAAELTANTAGFYTVAFAGLALLITRNTAMNTAIQNRVLKLVGSGAALKTAKANMKASLDLALAYVNNLARVDQLHTNEIITGCLMVVIISGTINKPDFAIYQGATGEIILDSLVLKIDGKEVKTTYEHESSTTPAEPRLWVPLLSTSYSKDKKGGMTIDIKTYVRRRRITKKGGVAPWCTEQDITLD